MHPNKLYDAKVKDARTCGMIDGFLLGVAVAAVLLVIGFLIAGPLAWRDLL